MTNRKDDPKERHTDRPAGVNEARELAPTTDAEGLTRLVANDRADDANPIATDAKDVKKKTAEKSVEAGVAEQVEKSETEWELTPHSI
jgi:hypothetical protein